MKPALSIWTKPLETFDFLSQRGDTKNRGKINVIFFLSSMTAGFSNAYGFYQLIGNHYVALIIGLIFSGLIGLLIYNTLFTYTIWIFSKLLQGKASINQIRLTIAYALIPNILQLIFGLIKIIPATITNDYQLIAAQNPIMTFVIWLFYIRILVYGLAFFNKYTYGYALLTIFLPAFLFEGLLHLIR